MIKEQDLLDAIAECQGERNPNANTCIKLAAFYTILNNIRTVDSIEPMGYSYADGPVVNYKSGTEFSKVVSGLYVNDVMAVMDEVMDAVSVLAPKMYYAALDKLKG